MGNFEDSFYASRLIAKAMFRAEHILGLNDPYLAMTQDNPPAPPLHRAIAQALRNGVLSLDDSAELYDADIIISNADNHHVVFEVSITAEEEDITRARRRADLLTTATGGAATPALITANLNAAQREQAAAQEVATFLIPYP